MAYKEILKQSFYTVLRKPLYTHRLSKAMVSSQPVAVRLESDISIARFFEEIHKILDTPVTELRELSHYHFDCLGKAIRPKIVMLAAKAFNFDVNDVESVLNRDQLVVAMVAEMIHTASLVHDDIIDDSPLRRGKPTVFSLCGQTKAAYAGDYIIATASVALSRLRHNRVMQIMSEILENLVQGEFMQLGTKEKNDARFNHYIDKSYKKTASLIANSCKSVAVLSGATEQKIDLAFQFGKNLGIAFQLVDDMLDFVSNQELMGKPTSVDLKLGLATAPVLFASYEFPRLNTLILRRFSKEGDIQEALELVRQSNGLEETKLLALKYSEEAIKLISQLKQSRDSRTLIDIAQSLITRNS